MVDVIRVVLASLVVASLIAIALYVVASVAVTAWTLREAARRRRLADDLDQVLVEILGPRAPEAPAMPHTRRWARRS